MSSVGVVHLDLGSKGGGEAVAMNVLEALQPDHDVSLITVVRPDIEALNRYFNTDVDPDRIRWQCAGHLAPAINRQFGMGYYVLQNALLGRYARRHADEYDLLVSTINELGLPAGSIEYVHFPFDWTVGLDNREDIFHPTIQEGSRYEWLCARIADVSHADIRANTIFANSGWTADCFERAYGHRPEVLYPPVDLEEFTDVPWNRRQDGFVTVGRIERSKRIVDLIRIVDHVRGRGHDVHLHVIGPTYEPDYAATVAELAAARPYIELEGEVSRSTLVRLLVGHRYGLHGKEHEHFGMAIAEIVAGGAIPFVPATGGQHTIVRDDERLLYTSDDDAVEKIDRVLSMPSLQRELRMNWREIERRFGRRRFQTRVREAVAEALDTPVMSPIHQREASAKLD